LPLVVVRERPTLTSFHPTPPGSSSLLQVSISSEEVQSALAASARALARSSTPILQPRPLFAYLYLSNELHHAPLNNHDQGSFHPFPLPAARHVTAIDSTGARGVGSASLGLNAFSSGGITFFALLALPSRALLWRHESRT
jgi:hypothetical protein